jgi:hypothetical protein
MLHIEAEPLPVETRNRVLGEVFGMQPEDDENELPFQVLDDEIADLAEDGPSANTSSSDVLADGESPEGGPMAETVTLDANDI